MSVAAIAANTLGAHNTTELRSSSASAGHYGCNLPSCSLSRSLSDLTSFSSTSAHLTYPSAVSSRVSSAHAALAVQDFNESQDSLASMFDTMDDSKSIALVNQLCENSDLLTSKSIESMTSEPTLHRGKRKARDVDLMTDDQARMKRPHHYDLSMHKKDLSQDRDSDTSGYEGGPHQGREENRTIPPQVKLIKILSRMVVSQKERMHGLQQQLCVLENDNLQLKAKVEGLETQLQQQRQLNTTLQYYIESSNRVSGNDHGMGFGDSHYNRDIF